MTDYVYSISAVAYSFSRQTRFLHHLLRGASINHEGVLDMRVLTATIAPVLQPALLFQMVLPLDRRNPLAEDHGAVNTKGHANDGHDDGNERPPLAAVVTLLQGPGRVALHAARVDFTDVVHLHGNVYDRPAQEHEQESPRGGDKLAVVPCVSLMEIHE